MSNEFEKTVLEELNALNNKIDSGLERLEHKFDSRLDQVNSRLGQVDSRLDQVDSRLDQVDSRLGQVDSRLDQLEKKVDKNTSDLKEIKHSIEVMNQSIVLLEHRLTFEVPALYDGYSMCRDMQEIQHSRLNSLSFKVEDHDNRISILEQKA